MEKKREPYDLNSPGTKERIDEIVHGNFVREGTMAAFATNFPGTTVPVPPDESRIAALDVSEDGNIYCGTSGRQTHLLVGFFKGVTGAVFDMGAVEGAEECTAICCGKGKFAAAVNGPSGGRFAIQELQPLPFDLIQEWGFQRKPFRTLEPVGTGERILHAVADSVRERVVGLSENHLILLDLPEEKASVVRQIGGTGRISRGPGGLVYGLAGEGGIWTFNPQTSEFRDPAVRFSEGDWGRGQHRWAFDRVQETLYLCDDSGNLFLVGEEGNRLDHVATITPKPVKTMAVTNDGRLFGFSGDGIGRLFCYQPRRSRVLDLGCAVSVIQRRRYGYTFADAVVGRDGEIVFAEDDNAGHLWLYFPRIEGTSQ